MFKTTEKSQVEISNSKLITVYFVKLFSRLTKLLYITGPYCSYVFCIDWLYQRAAQYSDSLTITGVRIQYWIDILENWPGISNQRNARSRLRKFKCRWNGQWHGRWNDRWNDRFPCKWNAKSRQNIIRKRVRGELYAQ